MGKSFSKQNQRDSSRHSYRLGQLLLFHSFITRPTHGVSIPRCPSRNNDILNSSFTLYQITYDKIDLQTKHPLRSSYRVSGDVGGAFSGGCARRDSRGACFGDLTRYTLLVVFIHAQCSTPTGVPF